MPNKKIDNKIPIYNIQSKEEILKYYINWTKENKFNQDMKNWNYQAPQNTVKLFNKYTPNKNIRILDGGMGQELLKRSSDTPTSLWATQLMIDNPNYVKDIHNDYFIAGADICTANTYAIHHDRLARAGKDKDFEALHRIACQMAKDARDDFGQGLVAGSLGPLGWSYSGQSPVLGLEAIKLFEEIIKKTLLELGAKKETTTQIIIDAKSIEENSNQILDFTKEVKNLPETDKIKIIESLWSIIFSDNEADIYETNLMRRLAGLLYIDSSTMGVIKDRIKKEKL